MAVWSELDAESRRTISRFGLKLSLFLAAAVAFSAHNQRPLLGFAKMLEFWLYAAGLFAALAALITHQKPQQAVITQWDEALGFGALCLLTHIGLRLLD